MSALQSLQVELGQDKKTPHSRATDWLTEQSKKLLTRSKKTARLRKTRALVNTNLLTEHKKIRSRFSRKTAHRTGREIAKLLARRHLGKVL